ncbi:response regulator [Aquabacterium sp.]|uniref:response regulator n=1 Tax=Aquabacterium sp. TaxID=1872578 RepID=UPI00248A215B|nr:response regulator [Aquabacterium sp.]MDI1261415.1 response regulator [Aquabacterium sp.]
MKSSAPTPAPVSSPPTSALLVDDDDFMLDFVGDMLSELGLSDIKTANSGISGAQVFDQSAVKPEVVLCDLCMPDSDGFEFMEALAERKYAGGVILVSGMDSRTLNSASLMGKFHRLKILATISKPVNKQALSEALSKLR